MVTIANDMKQHIIRELLAEGGNHRLAVFQAINETFIRHALEFLERATQHKAQWEDSSQSQTAGEGWYLDFLRASYSDMDEAEMIGAMPKKTIGNIYGGKSVAVVQGALQENVLHLIEAYDEARALHAEPSPAVLSVNGVEFSSAETVLLINSLAVKRQQISGGFWSAVGMGTERPLLQSLCALYELDEQYHRGGIEKDNRYQVDYMLHRSGVEYRCEVKLNGKGNPESVTSAIARDPRILFADFISEQNREKLDSSGIAWIDFSDQRGFRRFRDALLRFKIPHTDPPNLDRLDDILDEILPLP
ncbi:MAG: CfrBI family restriction endonuclease [Chloroflexi bacterium]|nr:CfrBI family restriction endonuclease [Chloroflexota bacterium]MYF22002.1 CfrBI family restriction endonuclease [Chloroflexota bacterium]